MTITPAAAASEILRRRFARNTLAEFAQAIDVPGKPASEDPDEWLFTPVETVAAAHHILLMDTLDRVVSGDIKNLMVFMPPGSAKSTYTSVVFPAYLMGKKPGTRVIMSSYASAIAWKQSRRTRQIVKSAKYQPIFDAALVAGNQSVEEWALDNGSEYMAGGLLSGMTGNRASIVIVDDPVAGREDAESQTIREKTKSAFEDDLQTRLIPGGSSIIIQCMVGDTPVLMADGTERPLKHIRVGDAIATYSDGRLSISTVQNWANKGPDCTYKIRTSSGITVAANERHPFLVECDGDTKWVRLRDLKIGDKILRASAIGASGEGQPARTMAATSLPSARGSACPTTTRHAGQADTDRLLSTPSLGALRTCATGTVSTSTSTTHCSPSKAAGAPSANSLQSLGRTCERTGTESCASTTTTKQAECAVCCATTATSLSDTARPKTCSCGPLSTYEIVPDGIVEIVEAGREDVFDIQVARTENFIANGLVSHNTRWHEDDLSGGILPTDWDGESGFMQGRDGQRWYVLCLPAVCDREDDPLRREIGDPLWPEWFNEDHFDKFRGNPRTWSALFQQKPRPSEGAEFNISWIERYQRASGNMNRMILVDPSSGKHKDRGDYTSMWVVGLGADQNIYVLDIIRDRLNLTARIDALMTLHRKWKPIEVRYEQYGLQADIEAVKAEQERQEYRFKITEVGGSTKKEDRIRRLVPWFENGRIYLPLHLSYKGEDMVETFIKQEYTAFPVSRHDDMLDALARLCEPELPLKWPKEQMRAERSLAMDTSTVSGMGPLG